MENQATKKKQNDTCLKHKKLEELIHLMGIVISNSIADIQHGDGNVTLVINPQIFKCWGIECTYGRHKSFKFNKTLDNVTVSVNLKNISDIERLITCNIIDDFSVNFTGKINSVSNTNFNAIINKCVEDMLPHFDNLIYIKESLSINGVNNGIVNETIVNYGDVSELSKEIANKVRKVKILNSNNIACAHKRFIELNEGIIIACGVDISKEQEAVNVVLYK